MSTKKAPDVEISGFGTRLKEAFEQASNVTIASKIGVTSTSVGYYVNHDRIPDIQTVLRIWKSTQCSIHWLLTGEGPKYLVDAIGQEDLEARIEDIVTKKFVGLFEDHATEIRNIIDRK